MTGVRLDRCPVCGSLVETHLEGWLYDHEAGGETCPGSGLSSDLEDDQ